MEKLQSICLQYAAAAQRLITSSIDSDRDGASTNLFPGTQTHNKLKLRIRSQKGSVVPENSIIIEAIL